MTRTTSSTRHDSKMRNASRVAGFPQWCIANDAFGVAGAAAVPSESIGVLV